MVRITRILENGVIVVSVDGKLEAQHVPELFEACRVGEGTVALDLTELRNADSAGFRAIQTIIDDGVSFLGAQPFIALRLQRLKEEQRRNQEKSV